jgi:very-short-patch-repair endonuclease
MAQKKTEQKKYIVDGKTIYLVKTLSRTKRKDYENYVINAIWQRLGDNTIEPVSQQYVHNSQSNQYYFIDLYFPALNIGIECDEAHHLDEANQKADTNREANIYDALHKIEAASIYKTIRIDVTEPYEDVEKQIDDAVNTIKARAKELKKEKKLQKWVMQTPEEYFAHKNKITIDDKIGFQSISQTCNILFATDYIEKASGRKRGYFTPQKFISESLKQKFRESAIADYKLWFPKLAIKDEQGTLISARGTKFVNQLINDKKGTYITATRDDIELSEGKGGIHITFAFQKDALGITSYTFVGVFEYLGKGKHQRIADECPLIKKE